MIEKLIRFSIYHNSSVLIVTGILVLIGIFNVFKLPIDAIPDVTNVQVSAVTKAPSLSPTEVEQFITYPIEIALTGLPNVTEIRSISRTGVSSVTVVFKDHVDIYFARQLVNERLKLVESEIPSEYGKPELSPISTGLGDIYEFVLTSEKHSLTELRTYMEWELSKKIKSLPGIIDVNVLGGEVKQYQILIKPIQLSLHNLDLTQILGILRSTNRNIGGGYIMKSKEQYVIRGQGQIKSLEELGDIPIITQKDGTPLLLKHIADLKFDSALRFGIVSKNGKGEVVGATAMMLIGENSREVVQRVKKEIEVLKTKLPAGMKIETFYDRSEFIDRTLSTVFINLLEGALLVVVCLIVTLGTIKGALIVAAAIPVSMLITVIFMRMFGVIGNLMSLGAIDFGLLVDGSVVMLEAILAGFFVRKNLFENTTDPKEIQKLTLEAIIESCTKVGRAATFSVGIIMMIYLPLMALEGVEGRMFRPMAITVALALGFALLYTLTTFPALMVIAYKKPMLHHSHYWDIIEKRYGMVLDHAFQNKSKFIAVTVITVLVSLVASMGMGAEFIPRIDEGELSIDIKRLPSTSLNYSRDLNLSMEKLLLTFPEVTSVVTKLGRGESAAEPIGTEEGEVMIKLKSKKSDWTTAKTQEDLMEAIKVKIEKNIPSTYISLSQPIENKVNALLSGSKADVVIKINGDDLLKLKEIGDNISNELKSVQGTGDLRVQRIMGLPILEIKPDLKIMSRYGVSTEEVLATVEMLRIGSNAGKVYEGLRGYDVVTRLDVEFDDIEKIENIPIKTANASTVPLGLIASVKYIEGPAAIYRESLKRRIFVEVNVRGRDLVSFVNEAKLKTEKITSSLPPGYEVSWGGQFDNFTRAKDKLILLIPIAMAIIFGMLISTFGSPFYALGVFFVVPLAASGGVFALAIRGLSFSIPALVGFIALSGISVLNGVIYASILKQNLEEGMELEQAIKASAIKAIRPSLITELIAAIGFIPMAISSSAGAEVQKPLATVVIGGIIVATVLANLILPITMQYLLKLKSKITH